LMRLVPRKYRTLAPIRVVRWASRIAVQARAKPATTAERAWTAILDANVTTLIGASVLYFLGTSSIKSFAVILFLGVIVHLFTAVTVSRWFVTMFTHTRYGQTLSHYGVPRPPSAQATTAPAK